MCLRCLIIFPQTRTTRLGRRSFFITAPVVWNSLPLHLRSPSISRSQFQAGLNTHLFSLAFHWLFLGELLKTLNWTELGRHKTSNFWQRTTDIKWPMANWMVAWPQKVMVVTPIFIGLGPMSRKRLEIEAQFQRTTNRKWPMVNWMVTWPMTSRYVTLKSQGRDPNTPGAQYLKKWLLRRSQLLY